MPTALVLVLAALLAAPQDPPAGVVRGQVRSEQGGEPLPYAVVEVVAPSRPLATLADSAGNYVLRGIAAGRRLLRARHQGHAPLEVEVLVPAGREVLLDFSLTFRPVPLSGVTVEVAALPPMTDSMRAPEPELSVASLKALEASPGVVELGLGDLARGVPGHEPVDPSDVLYVRGAPADLKLVLLDGAPVYAPFHLGGLVQAFEPEVLRSAELYLGGAPARYDGGLSYVLDLETRAGDRTGVQAAGAVDLLSSRAALEGPLGRHAGFLLGGRAVHGRGTEWLLNDRFPYGYADALGRVDVAVGERGALGLTGFWNHEAVRLEDGPDAAEWGNRAASLRYRGPLAGADAELTLAFGSYQARLPLGGARPLHADGVARRSRLAADFARPGGAMRLLYGFSYERLSLDYHARSHDATPSALLLEASAAGAVGGAYVDAAWQPAPRVRLRGGLRADLFSLDAVTRYAPRFSATWLLSERAVLTLAAGRYRQLVRSAEPLLVMTPGATSPTLYVPEPLSLARASHLVVGLDQELGEGIRLGIEGFYKEFDGLPATVPAGAEGPAGSGASAQASGVDLWLRRGAGRITGWLGYSLAWIWSVENGRSATDLFAGRQLLSAGVAGPIGSRGRFDLRLAYGAGLPYSAIAYGTADNAYASDRMQALSGATRAATGAPPLAGPPDEAYLRMDAEISRPWSGEWRGRPLSITPYLRVLNALDRRDAMFYRADRTGSGEVRPLAPLPLLPVLGVQWSF